MIEVTQINECPIKWGTKTSTSNVNSKNAGDISIKYYPVGTPSANKHSGAFGIVFRNNLWDKYFPKMKGISVGIEEERLYFKGFEQAVGNNYAWAISPQHQSTKSHFARISINKGMEEIERFVKENQGEFELKWDYRYKLPYVTSKSLIFAQKSVSRGYRNGTKN